MAKDALTANLETWRNSLQMAYVGGVRSVPPTIVANRISHIAIATKTGTPSMPLVLRSLYIDARERREREDVALNRKEGVILPFRISGIINAISGALAIAA